MKGYRPTHREEIVRKAQALRALATRGETEDERATATKFFDNWVVKYEITQEELDSTKGVKDPNSNINPFHFLKSLESIRTVVQRLKIRYAYTKREEEYALILADIERELDKHIEKAKQLRLTTGKRPYQKRTENSSEIHRRRSSWL